jgi:hypothetical protein
MASYLPLESGRWLVPASRSVDSTPSSPNQFSQFAHDGKGTGASVCVLTEPIGTSGSYWFRTRTMWKSVLAATGRTRPQPSLGERVSQMPSEVRTKTGGYQMYGPPRGQTVPFGVLLSGNARTRFRTGNHGLVEATSKGVRRVKSLPCAGAQNT